MFDLAVFTPDAHPEPKKGICVSSWNHIRESPDVILIGIHVNHYSMEPLAYYKKNTIATVHESALHSCLSKYYHYESVF